MIFRAFREIIPARDAGKNGPVRLDWACHGVARPGAIAWVAWPDGGRAMAISNRVTFWGDRVYFVISDSAEKLLILLLSFRL